VSPSFLENAMDVSVSTGAARSYKDAAASRFELEEDYNDSGSEFSEDEC